MVVLACLFLFVLLFLTTEYSQPKSDLETCNTINGLSVVSLLSLDLARDDYRALRARPELKSVCAQYRRDRRRIALLWLGELERDVRLVWEFRRFLVRNGLAVTFREEAAIALVGSLAMCYLKTVRLAVFLGGPFILPGALRAARLPVLRLSNRGAGLLAKAPADTKAQIERKWTQHVLSWSPA
jgi:hypothetical protein